MNDKYKFTEKERDTETNYDYGVYPSNGGSAGYYDSEIGRWLQVDPLGSNRPGLTPYNYVQSNPLIRFDPDGRTDWKAFIKAAGQTIISGAGAIAATLGMAGTTMATFGTAGASSPVTVSGLLWSFAGFTASTISAAEGVANGILALKTPDGMKAETLSIIKKSIKGLGGNVSSQEIAKIIFDSIGFQGIANTGHEGLMQILGIMEAGSDVSQDVINILNFMAKKEREKKEKEKKEEKKKNKEEEN